MTLEGLHHEAREAYRASRSVCFRSKEAESVGGVLERLNYPNSAGLEVDISPPQTKGFRSPQPGTKSESDGLFEIGISHGC
jgi:hypothetical protein